MESAARTRGAGARVDGGATANDWLMQFQADMLGRAGRAAGMVETTALGAAALAGLALGVWSSVEELRGGAAVHPLRAGDGAGRPERSWPSGAGRSELRWRGRGVRRLRLRCDSPGRTARRERAVRRHRRAAAPAAPARCRCAWPHCEQEIASGSARGPQAGQAGPRPLQRRAPRPRPGFDVGFDPGLGGTPRRRPDRGDRFGGVARLQVAVVGIGQLARLAIEFDLPQCRERHAAPRLVGVRRDVHRSARRGRPHQRLQHGQITPRPSSMAAAASQITILRPRPGPAAGARAPRAWRPPWRAPAPRRRGPAGATGSEHHPARRRDQRSRKQEPARLNPCGFGAISACSPYLATNASTICWPVMPLSRS